MLFDGFIIILNIIIICILYLLNKRDNKEFVKSNILKSSEIRRLNNQIDILNNIIKNNECNTKLDYDKIYYHSVMDRAVLNNGEIVTKRQYTTDITKAKNFVKYKNDYIEINKEDN